MDEADMVRETQDKPPFLEIDTHFARFMMRIAGEESPELFLAASLLSRAVQEGHVCLDLSAAGRRGFRSETEIGTCPEPQPWAAKLSRLSVVGKPGDFRPLILDSRARLYLHRYWEYESRLSEEILKRAALERPVRDVPSFRRTVAALFPKRSRKEVDWQRVAAAVALTKGLCVISGGPGTGKTTLMARVLAAMLEQKGKESFRISLCAPTGKAAARLQEAVRKVSASLPIDEPVRRALPTQATTIHRLLSNTPGSRGFRYHHKNPLPSDVVVVDEASMVDMALMSKLVQALSPDAGIILLGDKDQLSSVEAGAVLGDLCDTGGSHLLSKDFWMRYGELTGETPETPPGEPGGSPLRDCVVQLRKSYRFRGESGIGALSRAVNEGDGLLALRLMKSGDYEDIRWKSLPPPALVGNALKEMVIRSFGSLARSDPESGFRLMERFRILCALREGPFGVEALNGMVERILGVENLIRSNLRWYPGRPIMIHRNDYNLGLFNGDNGIVLPDQTASHDGVGAFFLSPEGRLRRFPPVRLPEHETVYAMTVHKSQGSEFQKVLLILPDRPTPVLTRELIYTAVTRAREEVEVWGSEELFLEGVSRRTERLSGLRDAIWGG